jgi:hypothetical protein
MGSGSASIFESVFKSLKSENHSERKSSERKSRGDHQPVKQIITLQKKTMNDMLLETGVYVAALKPNTNTRNYVAIGDRILSINGVRLANKAYDEVVEIIRKVKQDFSLAILKSSDNIKAVNCVDSERSFADNKPMTAYETYIDDDPLAMSVDESYDGSDNRFEYDSLNRTANSPAKQSSKTDKKYQLERLSAESSVLSYNRASRITETPFYRHIDEEDGSHTDTFDCNSVRKPKSRTDRCNQHKMTSKRYERHEVIRRRHLQTPDKSPKEQFLGLSPCRN